MSDTMLVEIEAEGGLNVKSINKAITDEINKRNRLTIGGPLYIIADSKGVAIDECEATNGQSRSTDDDIVYCHRRPPLARSPRPPPPSPPSSKYR